MLKIHLEKPSIIVAFCAVVFLSPAYAEQPRSKTEQEFVLNRGIGQEACSAFLATQENQEIGTSWILGFFTGANVKNSNHAIGSSTHAIDVVNEIIAICRTEPDTDLFDETWKVYQQLEQDNR